MAITATYNDGVTSKTMAVHKAAISSWAQNDELTVNHAEDNLGARAVKIIRASDKVDVTYTADYQIIFTDKDTTVIKALNATPVAVAVTVTVPTS